MTTPYYRPSGRFSYSLFPHALITTLAMLPCAWLYAWSMLHFHPFFQFFAPMVFSVILIFSWVRVCEKAKVRNPALMLGVSLVMSLVIWYGHWVFWASLAWPKSGTWPGAVDFLRDPQAIWMVAKAPPNSIASLMLGTVLELLLLVVLPVASAAKSARAPFCEASGTWPTEEKLPRRFGAVNDVKQLIQALEADPDQVMMQLPDFGFDPAHYTTLSLHLCPAGEAYLTISAVKETTSDGKVKVDSTEIVKQLKVSFQAGRQIKLGCAADNASAPPTVYVDEAEDEEEPTAAELEPALAAMQAGEFDTVLAAARPYVNAADEQLRTDANRLCALSCSRLEKWSDAASYWEAVFATERNGHTALQVATSRVMAGELAEGEEWIEKTKQVNEDTGDVTSILIHTNFISALKRSGYLRAALPYLEWVKQVYEAAHSTDSTFLTLRGVPFFESFLEQSAAIVDASMDRAQAHAWYASMLPHLDQDGQDALNAWLAKRAD